MNPGMALPEPAPLPADPWLLWSLLMLTFTLHVLPMNFVLGGSIVALVSRFQGRRGDLPHHDALTSWLARAMPVAIATAVTMGVAALLFLQVLYGRVFFASSVIMAWGWLSVVGLLIAGYYAAYGTSFRAGSSRGLLLPAITAVAALAIGFLYTTNMSLMLRPDAMAAAYGLDGRGVRLAFGDPAVLPRYLHMLTASLATAGVIVTVLGTIKRPHDNDFGRWAIRYGAVWFASATVINMIVGLWWLAALPKPVLLSLLGQQPVATVVFVGGITMALLSIVLLVAAAQAPRPGLFVWTGAGALLATLVLMIFTRDFVRRFSLEAQGFAPVTAAAPQWGPIVIFVVLLLVAIATVAWMVRALVVARLKPRATVSLT